jgi:Alpha/beta hydrolase
VSELFPDPRGDAVAVQQAAGKLELLAGDGGLSQLGRGFAAEGTAMAAVWTSPAAAAQAQTQVSRLAGYSRDYAERLAIAARVLKSYAQRLAGAKHAAFQLRLRAERAELDARQEAARHPDRPGLFAELYGPALRQLQQEYQEAMSQLDAAARTCAAGLEGAIPGFRPGMGPGAAAAAATAAVSGPAAFTRADRLISLGGRGPDGLHPPDPANDPRNTAAWWKQLSAEEQAKVVAAQHREVGALNGLPAAARSRANELGLAEDLASHDPAVRRNAEMVRAQLARVRDQGVPAQLLVWDPAAFGGDGRAAISYGDADTAHNLMVSVPGITSTVGTMDGRITDAQHLYDEVRAQAPGQSAAVVAWMGYNAPSGSALNTGYETLGSTDAVQGARLLTDDVNGLRAARGDDQPKLTLIGHSYGSVAVGVATSTDRLAADDVVLLGSPGTTMPRAVDLTPGPAHVWVGANSHDPVSYTNYWVTDPTDIHYGGTRFDAEGPNTGTLYHTGYYDAGSPSLRNIARVGVGDYAGIERVPGRNYWPAR